MKNKNEKYHNYYYYVLFTIVVQCATLQDLFCLFFM